MTAAVKGIDKAEMQRIRLAQLAQVFAKADCALAGRKVTVEITQTTSEETPAYTANGADIKLFEFQGQNMTSTKGLVVANGLNYHELCHVMYTPGYNTRLNQEVRRSGLYSTFNVLEDQRIESIITTKYPSTRPYLTATVAEYFIERATPEAKEQAWPIISGRKYLPKNMRHAFRSAFVQKHSAKLAADFDRVIGEYRQLRFGILPSARVVDQAMKLIREYDMLLQKSGMKAPSMPNPFAHGHQTATGSAGKNGGESDLDVTPGSVDKADKGEGSGAPGAGDKAEGKDKGEGSGEDGGDTKGAGGTGIGSGTSQTHGDMDKALESTLESVMSNTDVQVEIKSQSKSVNSRGRNFDGLLPTVSHGHTKPKQEVMAQSRSFAKQLASLVVDQDPGFDKYKDSGRLNINRVMRGDSIDSVFDQWSEGKQDAESLEVVVLLDASGSMDHQMRGACEAVWAVKNAVDSLPSHAARCTVIKFASSSEFLYRPNDRSTHEVRVMGANGGTRPATALQEAYRIFALSDRHKKILITVSDGGWSDTRTAHPLVEKINKLGVVTAAFHLGYAFNTGEVDPVYLEGLRHEHQMLVMGTEVGAITKLGKMLVKRAIRG
ncbi:CobT-like cobalamin biosynthesis protein [Gordonia phage ChisanaKitsune]|uniref:CobT-like cobalamin biosynthesis protein n=1 Tax=Gordonia phage ChisanaKitsune TaxID=2871538 RepID=A0AAE8BX88_9CAUD|nr:CobT-like cobalamin biosynthesis protein [Gordonia phage ChisanaKitsune]QZE10839.1 CobT-like cobalamin biosynthesis protein [Gordonia phage ChisanaKitsune]